MPESELATSFFNHNVVFVLPLAYKQLAFGHHEEDMIGIGTRVQHRTRNLSLLCGFVLLSALALQHPSALTLRDIGNPEKTRPATAAARLNAL